MKFLTLNLFKGKCLDTVIAYIKEEQFDIVHLQEVAGGSVSFPKIDCIHEIQGETGLSSEFLICWKQKGMDNTYFGNLTLFNPSSLILKERIDLRFKPFQEIDYPHDPAEGHPKGALFLRFECKGKEFWSVNTHLAWGPTPIDEPYKVEDAKKLANALKQLNLPFILSGDFNVTPSTKVIQCLEPYGRNLTKEYGLTNTLNERIHRAKHLFPPGLAVDYIFIHPSIHMDRFEALHTLDLSDHVGLRAEVSL